MLICRRSLHGIFGTICTDCTGIIIGEGLRMRYDSLYIGFYIGFYIVGDRGVTLN